MIENIKNGKKLRRPTRGERRLYPSIKGYDENGNPVYKKNIKENTILEKRNKIEKIVYVIMFFVMCFHALTLIFPPAWMFMSSLKGPLEFASGDPFALPVKYRWGNFVESFKMLQVANTTFAGMIFNSIWYTVIKTVLVQMVTSIVAYTISRFKFRGRMIYYNYIIITMTLPLVGTGAASLKLWADLGMLDTPMFVIVSSLGISGGEFLVLYGFYKSVSTSYAEAAKIDGANAFYIYFHIIMPQAFPVLLTYTVMDAMTHWNDYNTMILYLPSYPTLASGLFEYQATAVRSANYPIYYAGLLISAIPSVILFSFTADKMMTSLSIGGLKG